MNIWGVHRQKLPLLSSPSQWAGSHRDGETKIPSSLKHSTQISSQHVSGFNKLLLNQPHFPRAVGDKKSAVHTAGLPGRSALLPIPSLLAGVLEYPAISKNALPQAPRLFCRWWFENSQLSLLLQRKTSSARNCLMQQQDFLGCRGYTKQCPCISAR